MCGGSLTAFFLTGFGVTGAIASLKTIYLTAKASPSCSRLDFAPAVWGLEAPLPPPTTSLLTKATPLP